MDRSGLNAGQSAITSDFWQGDEAKFQKTFQVGPDAIFVDDIEINEDTGAEIAQLNMSIAQDGKLVGAITVDVNLRSEEHTSELQSLMRNSYAVFCLKKKLHQHMSISYTLLHMNYKNIRSNIVLTQQYNNKH